MATDTTFSSLCSTRRIESGRFPTAVLDIRGRPPPGKKDRVTTPVPVDMMTDVPLDEQPPRAHGEPGSERTHWTIHNVLAQFHLPEDRVKNVPLNREGAEGIPIRGAVPTGRRCGNYAAAAEKGTGEDCVHRTGIGSADSIVLQPLPDEPELTGGG